MSVGPDPPFVYDPETNRFLQLSGSGLTLGIMADSTHDNRIVTDVRTGHVVLAETDGVLETCNPSGQMIGREGVRNLIPQAAHLNAKEGLSGERPCVTVFEAPSCYELAPLRVKMFA